MCRKQKVKFVWFLEKMYESCNFPKKTKPIFYLSHNISISLPSFLIQPLKSCFFPKKNGWFDSEENGCIGCYIYRNLLNNLVAERWKNILREEKILFYQSYHLHLQWKFKLWAEKIIGGVKVKHAGCCLVLLYSPSIRWL